MNYLSKLSKNIKYKQKKQKVNLVKGLAVLSIIGITIGGVAKKLLDRSHLEEKKNIPIPTPNNSDEDINIKRDEIKHTLEEFGDEVVGDVGVAMEKALDGLEYKKDNEIKK
ncbi:hypothetical protein [Clostridium estertheticum]|uniref:Uncharacterized protein n=2 Tax=Clostridium estertheticum TaxID=238834 RepID=A0A1J0GHS8_9CLOT|nr:hypothetical protein [Clostridium estertheticum]APC40446.1 hypothetical protein A7L45_10390 [Clostridium estertheticum subsp. estertheticum]MBU3075113.1 hypothetical protein [Clostridium estertheticum]MBU3165328.1 hypothetical protein [Clostridium estertheticum]MBU3173084.1 hypothetical protein [Clostridium estertheticum]MBU3185809.1 hypothetical protein [Clostridium estertheticum]